VTFDEMVNDVMDRLNLTSTDARDRIRIRVNDRYRRVTSAIGLNTSRRFTKDVTIPAGNTALPDVLIEGMEKVVRITRTPDGQSGITVLPQVTYDEIDNVATVDGNPQRWAIKRMGAGQVIISLDSYPTTTDLTLHVEGYDIADTLADDMEPFFPSDFHDILIEGAMSDELRKMEKPQLAQIAEQNYERRLSDLRMFIAKSSYLDIFQGKNRPRSLGYRPWTSRTGLYN